MNAFLTQHVAALRSALHRLALSPLNALLSLAIIGVALALPAGGWLALGNLQGIAGQLSGVHQISIFLHTEAGRKDVVEIETRLQAAAPGNWRFVSRDEALKHLQTGEGMHEIVAGLSRNPLPDAFVVVPTDPRPDALDALAAEFRTWPRVAHVQLDSAWSRRVDAFLRLGRLGVGMLAAIFAGALIAVTFNTIRLQILAHAAEIEVARLIGATPAFIRRPFLYFGAAQGALGGVFACALLALTWSALKAPLNDLLALYGSGFAPFGPGAMHGIAIASGGALLGWLGAFLSMVVHPQRDR